MVEPGDLIDGKYRLTRCLGQGGMGKVFEAIHEGIGKKVALKFLLSEYITDPNAVTRLHREARTAAAAGHHGIVDIHDKGTAEDGSPYLVMELLHGESLADMLEESGALDFSTAAYVTCHVLSALSAAHGAGIIHRDLKPDNIFLVDTGTAVFDVKLLDFGVSRIASQNEGLDKSLRLTRTGTIVGTPLYMSPEHARGRPDLDHRIDIYATGVILFECVTGKLPFEATNYNALIAKVITEAPPEPTLYRPDLPKPLEEIILRALAKDRDERYQTAAEMLADLLPFVDERSLIKVPLPQGMSLEPKEEEDTPLEQLEPIPTRISKLILAGGAALVALIAIVGLVAYFTSSTEVVQLPDEVVSTSEAAGDADTSSAQERLSGDGGEAAVDDGAVEAGPTPPIVMGKRWVAVAPGSFVMGSPMNELGRGNDERSHRVTLTKAYVISPTEVSQQEFNTLMGYNPSHFASCGPNCPVEKVSWHEAAAFSNRLSSKSGLEPCYACSGSGPETGCSLAPSYATPFACEGYRLPTEAEWEQAARAGTTTATFRGNQIQGLLACEQPNAILDPIAWFCGNCNGRTQAAGSKGPNHLGLFDMLGNVLEWCHDRYDDYPTGDIIDPWGGTTGSTRVFRGGSCHHYANLARAGSRGQSTPDDSSQWLGFRLVRSVH